MRISYSSMQDFGTHDIEGNSAEEIAGKLVGSKEKIEKIVAYQRDLKLDIFGLALCMAWEMQANCFEIIASNENEPQPVTKVKRPRRVVPDNIPSWYNAIPVGIPDHIQVQAIPPAGRFMYMNGSATTVIGGGGSGGSASIPPMEF